MRVDGANVERLLEVSERPLVSVFLPDRLELIKGAPVAAPRPSGPVRGRAVAGAGGHPPQLCPDPGAAQRPDRPDPSRAPAAATSLHSWDAQLAQHGIELMSDRRAAVEAVAEPFGRWCADLGLDGEPELAYRPRSKADHRGGARRPS